MTMKLLPIEPGCKAMIYNYPDESINGNIVNVVTCLGTGKLEIDGFTAHTDNSTPVWEIKETIEKCYISFAGQVLPGNTMYEKYLMRIDGNDALFNKEHWIEKNKDAQIASINADIDKLLRQAVNTK